VDDAQENNDTQSPENDINQNESTSESPSRPDAEKTDTEHKEDDNQNASAAAETEAFAEDAKTDDVVSSEPALPLDDQTEAVAADNTEDNSMDINKQTSLSISGNNFQKFDS
jgi:hypothetical protein